MSFWETVTTNDHDLNFLVHQSILYRNEKQFSSFEHPGNSRAYSYWKTDGNGLKTDCFVCWAESSTEPKQTFFFSKSEGEASRTFLCFKVIMINVFQSGQINDFLDWDEHCFGWSWSSSFSTNVFCNNFWEIRDAFEKRHIGRQR